MLRKMSIVVAVIALGLTAIQTDAFARGGGGGGHGGGGGFGGGGHMGGGGFGGGHFGGGGFGGGHIGGFGGGRIGGLGGGHMGGFGGPRVGGLGGGHIGVPHGGFTTRNSGLRFRGDRFGRRGFVGGWGGWCDDWPYDSYYGYGYYNSYCY